MQCILWHIGCKGLSLGMTAPHHILPGELQPDRQRAELVGIDDYSFPEVGLINKVENGVMSGVDKLLIS